MWGPKKKQPHNKNECNCILDMINMTGIEKTLHEVIAHNSSRVPFGPHLNEFYFKLIG